MINNHTFQMDIHVKKLIEACRIGDLTTVKTVLSRGIDIHAEDDRALLISAENGHFEIVKFLIENGANIHAQNDCILVFPKILDNIEIIEYLIKHGIDIQVNNNCVLKSCAIIGNLSVIKFLIKKGVNINHDDDFVFRWGAFEGHLEMIKFVFKHGVDIHALYNHALIDSVNQGHLEIVEFLISKFDHTVIHNIDFEDIHDNVKSLIDDFKKDQAKTIIKLQKRNVELFSNIIMLCDGYLKIKPLSNKIVINHLRFVKLLPQLPMELQMKICNHAHDITDDVIKSNDLTPIVKDVFKQYENSKI